MAETFYKIGDFSLMAKLTVKALRFYEEVGLLFPAFVDEFSGYRYYSASQLYDVARITSFRQAGLSIEAIQKINSGADFLTVLQERQEEAEEQLESARRKSLLVKTLINNYKENKQMEYQAIVKTLPRYTVYYQRGVIANFGEIVDFIMGSAQLCLAANPDIKCIEPDYCFVAYLDGEYKEKDISIEYAQAVTKAGVETDKIKFRVLPETKAVCVYHKGPYEQLGQAYAYAYKFLKDNGYKPSEVYREHYIDGMWNKENPADWLTEIQIPIK